MMDAGWDLRVAYANATASMDAPLQTTESSARCYPSVDGLQRVGANSGYSFTYSQNFRPLGAICITRGLCKGFLRPG